MSHLKYQFKLIQYIRDFFNLEGFLDVLTPPMVENPGMEVHIHPFEVYSAQLQKSKSLYLHTSPEFFMKKLLLQKEKEFDNIFTISYCFRDEPDSPIHRSQFLMLEWYRKNIFYEQIKKDLKNLILYCLKRFQEEKIETRFSNLSFTEKKVDDLFKEYLNFSILDFLEPKELRKKIEKDFKQVPLPESELEWDDLYFLLFLNEIEPKLKNYSGLILDEYPAPLRALSTLKPEDPRVCQRFELYLEGIEIANCFNELTDPIEQIARFEKDAQLKKELYNYNLPWPKDFIKTIESNYPASSGIALGVERLLMSLLNSKGFFIP